MDARTSSGASSPRSCSAHDVRFFDLRPPLAPGERVDLVYDFEFAPKGFAHKGPRTFVVENGTFADNGLLPVLGYDAHNELESDRDRSHYGLAPKERMAPRDDPKEVMKNYLRQDSGLHLVRRDDVLDIVLSDWANTCHASVPDKGRALLLYARAVDHVGVFPIGETVVLGGDGASGQFSVFETTMLDRSS